MTDAIYPEVIKGMNSKELLKEYHQLILHCLVKYGEFDELTAKKTIKDYGLFKRRIRNAPALRVFFHEGPYYWAMAILHSPFCGKILYDSTRYPRWSRDPKLWPPPKDCYDQIVTIYEHSWYVENPK